MSRSNFQRYLFVAGLLGSFLGAPCVPLRAADEKPASPEQIVQQQPGFYVKADVDHANREYREGDRLGISVVCEQDAYIYALYKQADGKVYQIFPNSGQTDNKVKAKAKVTIPGDADRFIWKVDAPFGKELVKVIASKEPIKDLSDPELRKKLFNPVKPEKVKELFSTMATAEPPSWTEDQVEITTHDKSWGPPPAPGKRFGVFIGAGTHRYDDLYKAVIKESLNRTSHTADAAFLNELMRQAGRLDDSRVLLNERATRAAIEEAITQWLPSVSQPGDTVFIHFSGPAGMISYQAAGRGYLSFLCPHDIISGPEIVELHRREKERTITAEEAGLLNMCRGWLKDAKTDLEMLKIFAYRTGIPNDMFGHWLQRLAGRQVVVLLGACYAGGFAEEGKDIRSTNDVSLQYLDGQLTRLNDLGQGDVTLLAACGFKEQVLNYRIPDEHLKSLRPLLKGEVDDALPKDVVVTVFGYYVLESLLVDPAPLTIETMHEHCRRGTVEYIAKVNAMRKEGERPITVYEPRLFRHGNKPVLLKPGEGK